MDGSFTFNKLKEYFDKRAKLFKVPVSEKMMSECINPFITISRETGAGEITLGEKLVSYLNKYDKAKTAEWLLLDKNLLEKVSEDHKISTGILNSIPEKKIPEVQGMIEQFFGLHPSMSKLNKKVSETIIKLATMGGVIIFGRGANIITRNLTNGLHIRLISSLEKKIENIRSFFNLDKVNAIKFIKQEDKDRENYIRKNFNKDIKAPELYSMIINLANIDIDDAVVIIAEQAIRMRKAI
ncbi:MAG: cytidylate kinase-like family protein [Ignavibacteria bacterium]|nr:cytidylate kinase-like family protein [Ignavibacteria bacterium]